MIQIIFVFLTLFTACHSWKVGDSFNFGYSKDKQQLVYDQCYEGTVVKTSDRQYSFELSEGKEFKEVIEDLHIGLKGGGTYDDFSIAFMVDFMREMQESEFSMSVSYYGYASQDVSIAYEGTKMDVLSETGKKRYQDPDTFKYFGLSCGDYVVYQLKQGAQLVISLNMRFDSRKNKMDFQANLNASIPDIVQFFVDFELAVTKYQLSGTVSIRAAQIGGDPSKLGEILKKDPSGKYYILTCDIENLDNCILAASGVVDYAVNMTDQIDFDKGDGLVDFNIGFALTESMSIYGIDPPASFVTEDTKSARVKLYDQLEKSQAEIDKLEALIDRYPVPWDKDGPVFIDIQKNYKIAKENYHKILQPSLPDSGARACFTDVVNCKSIADEIVENLTPIDTSSLEQIKYIMPVVIPTQTITSFWFYNNGGENEFQSWGAYQNPDPAATKITNIYIPTYVDSFTAMWDIQINGATRVTWNGRSKNDTLYIGNYWDGTSSIDKNIQLKINQWYFENTEDTVKN